MLPEHNPTSKADAAIAEIVENLHRREISAKERRKLIVAYADIVRDREAVQSERPVPIESRRSDGRGHRPEGVAAKVARDLGVTKQTVNRALASARAPVSVEAPPPPAPTAPADLAALRRACAAASAESRATFLTEVLP